MGSFSRKMMLILIALAMSLSLFACSKKENAPITSNWKYVSSDNSVTDLPIFVCDKELGVTLYLNGKVHYGIAIQQDNGSYRIEYIDSNRYIEAKITGNTMMSLSRYMTSGMNWNRVRVLL